MSSVLSGQKNRLARLWSLSWPAIIEQILGTMVSYVDTAMVGVLGELGSASVSINSPSIWLIHGILAGVGVGYSVQVSNAVGAEDRAKVRKLIRQAFLAALVCGAAACGLYEGLGGFLPRWMGAKPEVLPHAVSYMRIYCSTLLFSAMMIIFSAVLRCMGNTRTPLLFNSAANVINLILNFLFIYPTRQVGGITIPGLGLGVEGAAAASAIAVAAAAVPTVFAAFRQPGYETSLRNGFAPDHAAIRRAAQLGFPSAAERAAVNLGQIAMTALVGHALTTTALAANQIAIAAEGLCYLPAYGLGTAAVALVGQSIGAGKQEDARYYGVLTGALGFLMCLVTGAALYLFAAPLASLFNSDPGVVVAAAAALRVVAFAEPFFALSIILTNALQGAGDVVFPMMTGLVCMWLVRVPLAFVFVLLLQWGLIGVWAAMAADLVLRGILCAARWHGRRWMRHLGIAAV